MNEEQIVYPKQQVVQRVSTEGGKATYSIQVADVAPAATATDVLTISGAAGKIIKVKRVQITADATGSAVLDLYIYKRTAANTGGTAASQASAITKMDSSDPTPSALVELYSANPSALGTGTLLAGDHYMIPATTGNQYFSSLPWIEDFGQNNDKPVILRSAAESVCVSLNGQTLPAGISMYIRIVWTEEDA